jgi:hypothetical protein
VNESLDPLYGRFRVAPAADPLLVKRWPTGIVAVDRTRTTHEWSRPNTRWRNSIHLIAPLFHGSARTTNDPCGPMTTTVYAIAAFSMIENAVAALLRYLA